MNRENIKLWVKALRSGGYQQGTGALKKDGLFCCLGVACEVYQEEIGGLHIQQSGFSKAYEYDGEGEELPIVVFEWLGLEQDPLLDEKSAIRLNDDDHLSFDQIADAIEKTYGV